MLYVTCRRCSREISTGIGVGFAGRPVLGPHEYVCRSCEHGAVYHGPDYHEPLQIQE